MTLRKVLYGLLIFLMVFSAAVTTGLYALLGTTSGSRWVIGKAAQAAGPEFKLGRIEGTLLGQISFEGFDYNLPGMRISAERLSWRWRPIRLLLAEVAVDDLTVKGLRYEAKPAPEPAAPSKLNLPAIRLPVAIALDHALIEPLTLRSVEGADTVIDRIAFSGRLDGAGLEIRQLTVAAPQGEAALSGKLKPEGNYPFDVKINWAGGPGLPVPLKGEGSLAGDLVRFEVVHHLLAPVQITSEGKIALEEKGPRFQIETQWKRIGWTFADGKNLESDGGRLRLKGTAADYAIDLETELSSSAAPSTEITLHGNGDLEKLHLSSLQFALLNGVIALTGDVGWSPQVNWSLAMTGKGIDPGVEWAAWKGNLSVKAETEGRLEEKGPRLRAKIEPLQGTLRGFPLLVRADVETAEGNYQIRELTVRSGSARFNAKGSLAERWKMAWDLAAPQLAMIYPELTGSLSGKGAISGPAASPLFVAGVTGAQIQLGANQVAAIILRARIDAGNLSPSQLRLSATDIALGETAIKRVAIEGDGTVKKHEVRAFIDRSGEAVRLHFSGGSDGKRWGGTLADSSLQDDRFGNWTQQKPIPLQALFSPVSIKADEGCWGEKETRLCLSGQWTSGESWKTAGRVEKFSFSLLDPFMPATVLIRGLVDGAWNASGTGMPDRAHIKLIPHAGSISYERAKGERLKVAYKESVVEADLAAEELRTHVNFVLTEQGYISSDLHLTSFSIGPRLKESRLKGDVRARLSQLGLLAAFTPMVESTKGTIEMNLLLGGTIDKPLLGGDASLNQGEATLPSLGIQLKGTTLQLKGDSAGSVAVKARAESGPGKVAIDGTVKLDPAKGWPVALHIVGDRFEAMKTPMAQLLASPDLNLRLQGTKIDLTGQIAVPEAAIVLKELPKGAASVSPDVVIVDAFPGEGGGEKNWEISAKVKLILGEKVNFSGVGLTARLSGEIVATDNPGQGTLGEGTLHILDGVYRAYGREITIEQGRLIFAGPIDNPGLDIRATRKVVTEGTADTVAQTVTAGVQIGGTLHNPRSTLFSEPPMDQSEVLSYLILGRPLNEAKRSEGSVLTQAISALGLAGGNLLAKKVGGKLGLEITFASDDTTQATSMVIGRYLSPRFYVSYGIGLFDSGNTFLVRYKISPLMTLRAQSAQESTIDLVYTREYQ